MEKAKKKQRIKTGIWRFSGGEPTATDPVISTNFWVRPAVLLQFARKPCPSIPVTLIYRARGWGVRVLSTMSDSYGNVMKGGLKLKGGLPPAGGVGKKKKKKDKQETREVRIENHPTTAICRHTQFITAAKCHRRNAPAFSLSLPPLLPHTPAAPPRPRGVG